MKGYLDRDGSLWLYRGGDYREQFCPYARADTDINCGDWCPLFKEPELLKQDGTKLWCIKLCHAEWLLDEFEDDRVENRL